MPYASLQTTTHTPDRLLVGSNAHTRAKKLTLLSGENRSRGAVLGVVAGAALAAAVAGNTGNGAMGAVTVGAGVKPGVYRVILVEPGSNVGAFLVEDPDGVVVGHGNVAAPFVGPVNFTLADGATDFVAGDMFTIAVAEGTKAKLAAAAATDGSAVPRYVLMENCDASAGDTECLAYEAGDFNEAALTIGAGHTVDTIREPLRARGIYLTKTLDV